MFIRLKDIFGLLSVLFICNNQIFTIWWNSDLTVLSHLILYILIKWIVVLDTFDLNLVQLFDYTGKFPWWWSEFLLILSIIFFILLVMIFQKIFLWYFDLFLSTFCWHCRWLCLLSRYWHWLLLNLQVNLNFRGWCGFSFTSKMLGVNSYITFTCL